MLCDLCANDPCTCAIPSRPPSNHCAATREFEPCCTEKRQANSRFCAKHAYREGKAENPNRFKASPYQQQDSRGYVPCACNPAFGSMTCWHPPGLPCPQHPWGWLSPNEQQRRILLEPRLRDHACYAHFFAEPVKPQNTPETQKT